MTTGLAPVRDADQLDWPRIAAYLRDRLPSVVTAPLRDVQQFTNGAANLTYLLHFGDRAVVLRRPPSGTIAPGAHDMKREWRVLSRLWRHFAPAPRAHLFCDDHAVAGADCFVMEHRPGVVIRGELPPAMAGQADVARRVGFALVDAMAALHLLDPERAELGDIGKPAGFVERQVSGWRKRWELAEARSSPDRRVAMADVAARLARAVPAPQRTSIVHNDLKLDNCAFDPADPDRVSAIFDWDMTTLGDPLIDVGTLLGYWPEANDPPERLAIAMQPTYLDGFPTRAEVIARYAARSGRDLGALPFFETFALFKLAVVLQQIYVRFARGQTQDERFAMMGESVRRLADLALATT